jgi:hypothetical protein
MGWDPVYHQVYSPDRQEPKALPIQGKLSHSQSELSVQVPEDARTEREQETNGCDGEQPVAAIGQQYPMESAGPQATDDPPARAICGARTRKGGACQRPPLAGKTRCRLHGGCSLAGMAHPNFKHGQRSKYLKALPRDLQAAYKQLQGKALVGLEEELGLITLRIHELLGQLGQGDDERVWRSILETAQDKSRTAAVQHRREVDLQTLVPVEHFLAFVKIILEAIKAEIQDAQIYKRVLGRVLQVLPREA